MNNEIKSTTVIALSMGQWVTVLGCLVTGVVGGISFTNTIRNDIANIRREMVTTTQMRIWVDDLRDANTIKVPRFTEKQAYIPQERNPN